jgi:hypothetical protein
MLRVLDEKTGGNGFAARWKCLRAKEKKKFVFSSNSGLGRCRNAVKRRRGVRKGGELTGVPGGDRMSAKFLESGVPDAYIADE